MAVPTITNIYPSTGHSGGQTLVRFLGGGFAPYVGVTFGGASAPRAFMVKKGRAYAVTPKSPLSASETGSGAGAVDVVLTNLDSDGDPIGGESVTVVGGYTYVRPRMGPESFLLRVVKALILELQRQVISEVVHSRHVDYAGSADVALGRVQTSTLPAVALVGPQLFENRVYGTNERTRTQGEHYLIDRRPPLTVDAQFSVIGAADKSHSGVNLQEAVAMFFEKNSCLTLDRDGSDPTKGEISFELDWVPGALPVIATGPDDSNVTSFTGTCTITGVILEGFSTIDDVPESDMAIGPVAPPPTLSLTTDTQLGEGAPAVDEDLPEGTAGAEGVPGAFEPRRSRLT
jgi:hypothetical protein